VAVLGQNVARELFGLADPVGQEITLNGQSFLVVGVLAPRGSTMAGSEDDQVVVPITAAERLVGGRGTRSVYLKGESREAVDLLSAEIEEWLLRHFRGDQDAFRIFNQTQMLETVSQVSQTMTLMLAGIAFISLLVGASGWPQSRFEPGSGPGSDLVFSYNVLSRTSPPRGRPAWRAKAASLP